MDIETEEVPGTRRSGRPSASMLARVPVFAVLEEGVRQMLATHTVWRRYDRGERLAGPGDDQQSVFVILQGTIRITVSGSEGQELTIYMLTAGDIIDLVTLPAELEAVTSAHASTDDAVAFRIPRQDFLRFTRANPPAVDLLFEQAQLRLFELAVLYTDHVFHDALTRLMRVLSRLTAHDNDQMVWASQTEIAHMTGMSREVVSRLLSRLKKRGLIIYEPHRKGIRVLDAGRLAEACRLGIEM